MAELIRKLALIFDAFENGLLALEQLPLLEDAGLDLPDDFFVKSAGSFLAIASDERDRIALVEQLDHAFDLDFTDLEVLCDPCEINGVYIVHRKACCRHDNEHPKFQIRNPRLRFEISN